MFDVLSPGVGYHPRAANDTVAALVTQDAWSQISGAVRDALGGLTLADLVGPADSAARDDRTADGLALGI